MRCILVLALLSVLALPARTVTAESQTLTTVAQVCQLCRFTWVRVEAEVGRSGSVGAKWQAFDAHCRQGGGRNCGTIADRFDGMIDSFRQDDSIPQICRQARLCR